MWSGRKTQQAFNNGSNHWPPLSINNTTIIRNLNKCDLGGVIFGCKHNTMQECLSRQLFGLPHGHFVYVRNIEEGLPLFLFNYSDRKLHGIYEAACSGHMSFDPYAWTDGGRERTPFPAQVYVRTRTRCQPLAEDQFGQVIHDNYFSEQHFWFELDHEQVRRLISLFKPLPASPVNKWTPISRKESLPPRAISQWKPVDLKQHMSTEASKLETEQKLSVDIACTSNCASLHLNGGDVRSATATKSGADVHDTNYKGTVSEWKDVVEDNVQNFSSGAKLNGGVNTSQKQLSGPKGFEEEKERVLCLLQKLAAERMRSKSPSVGVSSVGSDLDHRNDEAVQNLSAHDNCMNAQNAKNLDTSDSNHRNVELVQITEELRQKISNLEKQQVEKDHEMELLQNAHTDAERKIQLLQNRVEELESKIPRFDGFIDNFIQHSFGPDDLIYLIGGFDGCSWLSRFDCFSPLLNTLTPLKPMSSARSYAAVVALDGTIYAFGGGDGSLWLDSVECYNRSHDEWTSCPSMLREKGSLAGVSLNGKIYAVGGGIGVESLSDVEMFDPAQGGWINHQPMLRKRFAPAAAELNGAIYALGGYDGNDYLRSVERFDPREGTWTEAPSMNIRRGSHSAVVLNEKLYCVGGYDGEKMVSSMEAFDARSNSWVLCEPMKAERGYAGTAVLGNSLFAIGGVKDNKNIVDMVECYREETGWSTTRWDAIGKRCFCTAIVL